MVIITDLDSIERCLMIVSKTFTNASMSTAILLNCFIKFFANFSNFLFY